MRWLIQTCSSECLQVHRLNKGGTRGQKPNPQAHIHPGNFILSPIIDNMLLVTQKKEHSGILLPVTLHAPPAPYVLVPPPRISEVSETELDHLWGNNGAVRAAEIDDALFFRRQKSFDGSILRLHGFSCRTLEIEALVKSRRGGFPVFGVEIAISVSTANIRKWPATR